MNRSDYKEVLINLARKHNVYALAAPVLGDQRFLTQSGSHTERAHHYGKGGLLLHTYEVCSLALQTAEFYMNFGIRVDELFLSALWHDYGKIWDYSYDAATDKFAPNAETNHKRKIHHISRSAIEWEVAARKLGAEQDFIHRITHNILSHHGRRDYGSPVSPLSREAWILHLCDSLSARIDDCDRIDLVTINQK
jgi:3'-5' exoribonuclease